MTPSASELISAIDQAQAQFAAWRREDRLTDHQHALVHQHYELWRGNLDPTHDYADLFATEPGFESASDEVAQEARRLAFLQREVRQHVAAQRMTAGPAQACLRDVAARLAALREGLESPDVPVDDAAAPRNRFRLIELLLDPRSLQALMICGGSLLVLGLVIWLWSVGVFADRLVVACVLGGASLGALAGGVALTLRTQHGAAGRAIALLACLVLPLNLWFYDAQGLVTLNDGGHLWFAALVICGLYAATARLLKDPLFVYAVVGGVTMTGLLLLADQQVGRFWEVIAPSSLLVAVGAACVHAERLFAPGKGPFSRETFGAAFFRAGHFVLASGLGVLLGGRLVGWLYEPVFASLNLFVIPDVAVLANVKLVALVLAAVGAYTYAYSLMVGGRGRRYAYSAVLMLLWCGVIALDLLAVPFTEQLVVAVLAGAALAAHAASGAALRLTGEGAPEDAARATDRPGADLAVALGMVGSVSVALALLLGAAQFVRGAFEPAGLPPFNFDWTYVAAMLAVAGASASGAAWQTKLGRRSRAALSLKGLAAALLFALAGALPLAGWSSLAVGLPALALVPFGLLLVAERAGVDWLKQAWRQAAELGGAVLLLVAAGVVLGFAPATPGQLQALAPALLGLFFAESAALFGLVARRSSGALPRDATAPAIAAVSCWAAAWQWLLYLGFVTHAPLLAASVVGLALAAGGRLLARRDAESSLLSHGGVAWTGYALTAVGGVAGLLLAFNRLAAGEAEWGLLTLMLGQATAAALAGATASAAGARRGLFALAGAHVVVGLLVVNALSVLTAAQRVELFLTAVGGLLLVAGHLGWRKETGRADSVVTFNLVAGSLLAAGPLVCGLIAQRLHGDATGWAWVLLHEAGVLSVGLLLLGAGVLCRIRWTTLAGAATLLAYVGSLVALVGLPERLQNVAVYMMVGGAAFFAAAVLLSIYRDRVLNVPQRVRNGEGVFRVLTWR